MNKTNLSAWLAALCAALLVILLVRQSQQMTQLDSLRQQHEAFAATTTQRQQEAHDAVTALAAHSATFGTNLEARLAQSEQQAKESLATFGTHLEGRLAQSEQQAKEKLNETMNMVQQSTAVMHRAIGKVIPVELPESLTNKLVALEARIADSHSWPKDLAEADALLADLRALVKQIPAWAEEDYLPRLSKLRWAVQSLQVIQANGTVQGVALDDAADAYANLLSIQPDGGSTNIAAVLVSRQQDTTARFAKFRREAAINDAKEQLGLAVMTGGLVAWQGLSEWTNSPSGDQQAVDLRRQLHARLLEDDTSKFIASVDVGLAQAAKEPSRIVRQISFGKLLDNVVSQRQILLESPDVNASLSRSLTDLAARIEKMVESDNSAQMADQEKKSLKYQGWALSQIRKFNETMNSTEGTRVPTGVYDSNDYPGIKNAMSTYLVPISVGFLDPAVSRLYYEAFDRGWKKLENQKDLQTEVAKQEALTQKQKP